MNKKYFVSLINQYLDQIKATDNLEKILGCTLIDSPIIDFGWKMFEELMKAYFTEEGIDWIYYYLTENPENCYYEHDKRVPLETPEDLWKLVEDYGRFS